MLFPLVHESGFLSFIPHGSMLRVQKGCKYTKLRFTKTLIYKQKAPDQGPEAFICIQREDYFSNCFFNRSVVVDPGRSIGIPMARSQIKLDNVPNERATPNNTV